MCVRNFEARKCFIYCWTFCRKRKRSLKSNLTTFTFVYLWKMIFKPFTRFQSLQEERKEEFQWDGTDTAQGGGHFSPKWCLEQAYNSFLFPTFQILCFNFRSQSALNSVNSALFRNKRFMLDEMTYWNSSKFAIFLS